MLQRPQNGTSPPPPDNGVEAHELDDFGPRAPAPAPAEVPEPPEEESNNGSDRWSVLDMCLVGIVVFFLFIGLVCAFVSTVCSFIPGCNIEPLMSPIPPRFG
uniref:KASH domain-containing protein n=1 Tax=Panagrellus redivivus TaxID=6233 RepID=A0A7E4W5N7_PANRE